MNSEKRENLFWIDFIRAAAAVGVVIIHVAADVITEFKSVSPLNWWAANFYDSLVRGCVPTFIMVSGALLLSPSNESISEFFKKRAGRVLIPFLVWTFLYLLWKKLLFSPDLGWMEGLRRAAANQVHFHLWFFYILIGLYLVTPVFRFVVRQASRKDLLYFLILCFVMASFLPFVERFVDLIWKVNFRLAILVEPAQGFIGYFVAGYFLRQYAEEKHQRLASLFWIGSLIFCMAATYWVSARLGHYHGIFYENMAPNVAVYVVAFFVLAKNANVQLQKLPQSLQQVILLLSKTSFGIYLVHPMIMEALEKGRWGFTLGPRMDPPALMILATAAAVFLLSLGVVFILQKTPYLRRIV